MTDQQFLGRTKDLQVGVPLRVGEGGEGEKYPRDLESTAH